MGALPNLLDYLQRVLPGYRGYFQRDSASRDDVLVRNAVAQFLSEAVALLERERDRIGSAAGLDLSKFDFEGYRKLERRISDLRDLHNEVLSSPSGLRSLPRDSQVIGKLLELDYELITLAKEISSNPSEELVGKLRETLRKRRELIYSSPFR
jgi:hypothetical protein